MSRAGKITRRTLLIGSAAIAGGVLFGYWKYKQPYDNPLLANLKDGEAGLTPYVKIDQQCTASDFCCAPHSSVLLQAR